MQRFVKRLTVAAAIGMFVVLLQGALVTNTGSEEGCGRSWPLCHGEFIPSYAFETAVEYTHRFVAGIETILLVGAGIGLWYYWRQRTEIRIYAPLMVSFLVIQALLGAAAVMWPQTPEILALHFGISLVAFASVFLAAAFLYEENSYDRLRDIGAPRIFRWAVFGLLAYTYPMVYWGAYVRHKEVSLACDGWPLCNGKVIPNLEGPVGIVFGHRVSALVLMLGVVGLVGLASRIRSSRPDLFWGSVGASAMVAGQALTGAVVVWTRMETFAAMSHALFVALFFATLCYLAVHTLPRPRQIRAAEPETTRQSAPSTAGTRVRPAS